MSFTSDFTTHHIPNWERWLAEFKGKPVTALEIGCYEGRTSCWLLENILTHPDARLVCVDTFKAGQDLPERGDLLTVFQENIAPWKEKVSIMAERSEQALIQLGAHNDIFNLIYVDASHYAVDTLLDTLLAWRVLIPRGIMIMDDYEWDLDPEPNRCPKLGIHSFMSFVAGEFELIHKGSQMVLRKVA
jgi:predicted O-methyltransferase YrrM